MLKSIYIKDVASFDQSREEILENLNQINFIYGANGSGKTTISNFLLGNDPEKYHSCQAIWEHSIPLVTLVYNKIFREENFGDGKIAGVFTLGKATKEEVAAIEKNKNELTRLQEYIIQKKQTLQNQKNTLKEEKDSFDEDRWNKIYLKYKDEFKEAFRGSIGSKKDFTNNLISICDSDFDQKNILSIEEIKEKAETIYCKEPESIELFSLPSFDEILENEINPIWETVIVGKSDVDIAGLINKLGINNWVDKGRQYIVKSNICPFCQKETITDSFRNQLESFFNDSFKNKKAKVSLVKEKYENMFFSQVNSLKSLVSQEKEKVETKLDYKLLESLLKTLESQFSENREHLKNKLENVSNVYKLRSTESSWNEIKHCIEKANIKIVEHNRIVREFNSETIKLKKDIWNFVAEESRKDYKIYKKKNNGLQAGISSIKKDISEKEIQVNVLDDKIKELNKNVTSVQPTVDEINRLLIAFGFYNFSLIPSPDLKNYYTIQYEDGSLAHKSLSEGEITFITFLYFLQLVKGAYSEAGVSVDRIVIIDDPISSLDSNILFIVSTLIKGLIKDIKEGNCRTKQLLVLTHNVYFHKEASFIDGRTTRNNKTNYWIIRKVNKISVIQAYGMDNPIESSYELLWREVQNWRNNSGITVQNTMRRIIENYFRILGKYGDDDLIDSFENQEEREICRSLLCWINDGSHCFPDDLFVQISEDETERFLKVFRDIFTHTDNLGHYNMMMRINKD